MVQGGVGVYEEGTPLQKLQYSLTYCSLRHMNVICAQILIVDVLPLRSS